MQFASFATTVSCPGELQSHILSLRLTLDGQQRHVWPLQTSASWLNIRYRPYGFTPPKKKLVLAFGLTYLHLL